MEYQGSYFNSMPMYAPPTSSTTMSSSGGGGDCSPYPPSPSRPLRLVFSDQGNKVYEESFGPMKVTVEANTPGVIRDTFVSRDGKTVHQTETRQTLAPTVTVGSKQFREVGTFQGEPTSRTSVCYRTGNSTSNTSFDSSPVQQQQQQQQQGFNTSRFETPQDSPTAYFSNAAAAQENIATRLVHNSGIPYRSGPSVDPITVVSSKAFQPFVAQPGVSPGSPTYLISQLQRSIPRPYNDDHRRFYRSDPEDRNFVSSPYRIESMRKG